MKVIAVSGWRRSGKDLFAEVLMNTFRGLRRESFAAPLKSMSMDLFGLTEDQVHSQALKELPILSLPVVSTDNFTKTLHNVLANEFVEDPGTGLRHWTPRALLILMGCTMRAVSSSYWVDQAIANIKKENKVSIITDLRFKSEAEQLKKAFGEDLVLVRINRFDTSPSQDTSEIDLDDYEGFNYIINNKSSMEDFTDAITDFGHEIGLV